ncbi:MAG: amidase [Betaproteobacteria bacterium]|nr:amidase [Betaproteobacteria bacterium]
MLHTLTVAEAAKRIREGSLSPVELVAGCLERIESLEPSVKAWVTLCRADALEQAERLSDEARAGRIRGPLHGIPVGIKDIYHVAGVKTTAGARGFADQVPVNDATTVSRLKAAGAIILGKTATTEFAYLDPAQTKNPWNLERTPGGSSSGSAAAVAAQMAPAALGSQTVGSVLRPAAYCGVVGLKPTYGRISRAGIIPLAWSLDHVGTFSRSVTDAALLLKVLAGRDRDDPTSSSLPVPDYPALLPADSPPRLGLVREYFLDESTAEVARHIELIVSALRAAGAAIEQVTLPDSFRAVHAATRLIAEAEAAAFHADLFRSHADEYRPKIRTFVEGGSLVPAVAYLQARRMRRRFQLDMDAILTLFDGLVMPVAPAPAPDLSTTGDGNFCAPWSFAGLPAISLPTGLGKEKLPLAMQIVGGAFAEERLLASAHWCELVIGRAATPPLGCPFPS